VRGLVLGGQAEVLEAAALEQVAGQVALVEALHDDHLHARGGGHLDRSSLGFI